jgi:hypothetical protein
MTDEIEGEIIERCACGELLPMICSDDHMPHISSVYRRAKASAEFEDMLSSAQETGRDVLAAELLTVHETIHDPQRARLKADNIKWLLSRLGRAKYGDKLDVDHNHRFDLGDAIAKGYARANKSNDIIDVTPDESAGEQALIDSLYD